MEFRLLGPLEVYDDVGRHLPLGPPKQRALLALLLLHANEVVSGDYLVDGLWGESLPTSAANMLQGYVSCLRKVLEPERRRGSNGVLLTRAPGYMLRVEPEQLDTYRFERLLEQGRATRDTDPASAAAVLREALALWRGPPLADFSFDHSPRPRSADSRSCAGPRSSSGSTPTSRSGATTSWSGSSRRSSRSTPSKSAPAAS